MNFNSSFPLIPLPNRVKSTKAVIYHEVVFSTLDRLNVPVSWEEQFRVLYDPFGHLVVSLSTLLCGFTPYALNVRGGHPATSEGVLRGVLCSPPCC